MDKTGEDYNGLNLDKFEKRQPTFFSNLRYVSLYMYVSKWHLHSWKIILACHMAMILQMKDSWSANLMFRAHN